MKKIIAAAVAASMVVPCFSVSAAERVKEVSSVYGDKSVSYTHLTLPTTPYV